MALPLPQLSIDPSGPSSWPDRLREIAKVLDITDRMAVALDEWLREDHFGGPAYKPGHTMQDDLLALAVWIENYEG